MKALKWILAIILLTLASNSHAQTEGKPEKGSWTKGASDRFVGDVWVEYFINDSTTDFLSSRVLFQPNARSNWHKHSGKQIVFAIEGEGFYKEKGKPITKLKKGDVVIIEPGTIHSHGALTNRFMQGVMMNDVGKKETTIWMKPVSEEDL